MNNVDFLSSYLPTGAQIVGAFLDSPYYIDVEPYSSSFIGFGNETKEIFDHFNVTGVIPTDCAATYPGDDMWKCTMGQYRMPFLKTPFLLIASQFDSYQLGNNVGAQPRGTEGYASPDMTEYAEKWAAGTVANLNQLAEKSSDIGMIHSVSSCMHFCVHVKKYVAQ